METKKVLANSYVAHGINSGSNFATRFSNNFASKKSSLGCFITQNNYIGRHGKSIKLKGLEKKHRSWGCLAVNKNILNTILKHVTQPSLVLSYYPDSEWINSSRLLS